MNAPVRRIGVLVTLLFTALLISSTVVQFVQAPSLNERSDNRRTLLDNYSRDRGSILVGDQPIARSVPSQDGEIAFLRTYPQAALYAAVTGFPTVQPV